MSITERAEAHVEATAQWRQMVWKEQKVRDIPPMLGWMVDGDEAYSHAPTDVLRDLYQRAGDDTPSVVYSIIRHTAANPDFTRFREIVLVLDSYGCEGSYEVDGEPPSCLEDDFKTNPATRVTEQMTVVLVSDDLVGGSEAAVALKPYRISDGGEMLFSEAKVFDVDEGVCPVDPDIIDAMRWGIEHAHEG
jgi:hypothetical protein